MSANQILHGESLQDAAGQWLEELGKSDKDRLRTVLALSVAEKIRLSDCLEALYPGSDTQRALADLTRLRGRLNQAAEDAGQELRLHVDSKKKNPPEERECWFTGPDLREQLGSIASAASIRNLERLPALISEQTGFVYNPVVDAQTKDVDFAIVVALREEFEQIYGSIIPQGQAIPLGSDSAYVFSWQGYKGCIAFAGKMGPQEMRDLTRSVLERFKPRLIGLVGIAGGLDSNLKLGDVLVADMADEYMRTAKASATDEGDYELCFSGEVFPTTHRCVNTLKRLRYSASDDFKTWQAAGQAELSALTVPKELRDYVGNSPAIHTGHLATGDIVGSAPAFSKMLRKRDRKFAALEMEATGMLAAVHKHAPETQTIVLRGISDFADDRKAAFDKLGEGQFRQLAMRNATRLFFATLPRLLPLRRHEAKDEMGPPDLRTHQAQDKLTTVPAAYQPNHGCIVGLGDLASKGGIENKQGQVAAAEYILKWIKTGTTPFLAVLGEYGIGKTTTLKYVTRCLLDERKKDPKIPLPIFIDLRENYLPLKAGGGLPTLEEIIDESIRRNWKLEENTTLTAKDVLHLVQQQGAVIIFDGLDEKIVHMDAKQAQGFIRELWRALPPFEAHKPQRGKLILSCRSHYFPTITAQNNMLRGEDREGIRDKDYRACLILPFTPEQTQAYLRSALGTEAGNHAWEVITSIHNLQEVTARPYLLSLVTPQIERLEKRRARGDAVTAITLYDDFVEQWLARDAGKHKFSQAHKRELMENLAASLWRDGVKEWPWSRVESWLEKFYAERPVWQARYAAKNDFELLLEDVRTATFIVRPETSPENFRFAHTSLQEYFLAGHLARALRERNEVNWNLPMVSLETLDFLGQILSGDLQQDVCLQKMDSILAGDCLQAAVLAFKYWLEAAWRGHPKPNAQEINLEGADLEGWYICGYNKKSLLNLQKVRLKNARLNRSRVEFVDLRAADLDGVEARQALFLEVDASFATINQADLAGLKWRGGSISGASVNGTNLEDCELIHLRSDNYLSSVEPRKLVDAVKTFTKAALFSGHSGAVTDCAWSPNGERLVSASNDGMLKVWDARTGNELMSLIGHAGWLMACGWSPDGDSLLTAADDSTLKVWDAQTGGECLSLAGHLDTVNDCAWSPNGESVLSASADSTLKVWNARTGDERLTLKGHCGSVNACAWSPDGERVASVSEDGTLKVWDARLGREYLSLGVDLGGLKVCAWSPDGSALVSASHDGTLMVWDARTGCELLILKGHLENVNSCAWSPDGRSLASASDDCTLKIWNLQTGLEIICLTGHSGGVNACAWSPNGEVLVSAANGSELKIWNALTGHEHFDLTENIDMLSTCGWSPDGTMLVSASDDGILRVWDARTGIECLSVGSHVDGVNACAWSPDGGSLVSASGDGTLKLWDVKIGRELLRIKGHTSGISACAWSPDGACLVSASYDDTLKVWDARTGREMLSLVGHKSRVAACAWCPDGSSLVSASYDNTLKLWDARTGVECLSLTGHLDVVHACTWSPDGRSLLSASSDGTVKVWEARTGLEQLSLSGHEDSVNACAWSPDGGSLVSASSDGTLRVWDALTGCELVCIRGHRDGVWACGWSPDSRSVLSASSDGTMKVWNARTGECMWTAYHLPEGQAAAISGDHQRVMWVSPEAWRWLGWQTFDEEGRFLQRLPIEAFGPILGLEV